MGSPMNRGEYGGECGTPGCTQTATGISAITSGVPYGAQCGECHRMINVLTPELTEYPDREPYDVRVREIAAMDLDTLRRQAEPVLAKVRQGREAYHQLADLIGATAARDLATTIVTSAPTFVQIVNWWAAHRYPEHHGADAPEPRASAFRSRWAVVSTRNGLGIGTVELTLHPDGMNEAYRARDWTGGTIRPDLLASAEPLYDTPHKAAGHLAVRAAEMGWDHPSLAIGTEEESI